MRRYTIYGDLGKRESLILASVLQAKRLPVEFVPENPSLSLPLASRSGRWVGPYLRTPEGFVLAGLHEMLEWIERVHPEPELLARSPVRRTCARLLEDWLDLWLPQWPRRSWGTLERLAQHLDSAGFLLGQEPCRADWFLAGWLETEVFVHSEVRANLERVAPRLVSLGEDLLAAPCRGSTRRDDAIPISLLGVLAEVAKDYHGYLEGNGAALKDREDLVPVDLSRGLRAFPVERAAEARRIEIGLELAALDRDVRRRVQETLEPVGAWAALAWPPVLEELDPSDPRSL